MSDSEVPVLQDVAEKTRKSAALIESDILQRLARVTQTHAAACMDVNPSTVSRMVGSDDIKKFSQLLAALGLQVARTNSVVVDRFEQRVLLSMSRKYIDTQLEPVECPHCHQSFSL